jgi:hypothetical protein
MNWEYNIINVNSCIVPLYLSASVCAPKNFMQLSVFSHSICLRVCVHII